MAKVGGSGGGTNGEAGAGEAGDDSSDDDDDDDDEPDPSVLPNSMFCHFLNVFWIDAGLFGFLQYGKSPNFCAYTSCAKSKSKKLRAVDTYPQPYIGNLVQLDYSPDFVANASGGEQYGLFDFWIYRDSIRILHRLLGFDHHITLSSTTSNMSISKDIEEGQASRKDLLVLTREMPSICSSKGELPILGELTVDVSLNQPLIYQFTFEVCFECFCCWPCMALHAILGCNIVKFSYAKVCTELLSG